jgi:uncharacterized membrane protein YfcA
MAGTRPGRRDESYARASVAPDQLLLYNPRRMLPAEPLFWLFAAIAVTCTGLAKGGFAGIGMAATPFLALVVAPLEAAAIMLPILIMQDAISLWAFRREWDRWNLKVLLAGAVIGIGIAWALAAYVSDAMVKLMIGVITFVFVLNQWLGLARRAADTIRPGAASGVFWGMLSGFTSTFAHAGAPPMNVHLLPQQLPKMTYVGTVTVYFAAVNAIKVPPFFFLGEFTPRVLAISLVLMPLAIAANLAGIWIVKRIPEQLFYRIAYILMFIVSLELMRAGIAGVFFR